MGDFQQFQDLPQIEMEPYGPLIQDRFFPPSSRRQRSLSWNHDHPCGHIDVHDMQHSPRSFDITHPEFSFHQFMLMDSGCAQKAPRPAAQDASEPTGPYPHSVYPLRVPSPVESYCEQSEKSWSSFSGPLSPTLPTPDAFYSSGYSGISYPDFSCLEDGYSSRQNHDLLHISASRGRSCATDTFVNLQQVQQCPDTPIEECITLTGGPQSPPSLVLTMEPHLQHIFALSEDPSLCQAEPIDADMSRKQGQMVFQRGTDSGFVSSATDDDDDIDMDADGEADIISNDDDGDDAAESDFEPESHTRATRQANGHNRPGWRNSGKGAIQASAGSRSRRPSVGSRGLGHRVSKSSGSTKPTRTIISKPKIKEASSNTRPYPCLLNPLCNSTFSSKNEWKRHISTRHLALGFYRCPYETCISKRPSTYTAVVAGEGGASSLVASTADETTYNDFNRKDLFTQHLRRMHMGASPPSASSPDKPKASSKDKEPSQKEKPAPLPNHLLSLHESEYHQIRQPPTAATCSVCSAVFEGDSAWEERIECLGRHFGDWARIGDATVHTSKSRIEAGPDHELVHWMLQERLLLQTPEGQLDFV